MRKIGPFSADIVVACYVLHNQLSREGKGVPFSQLIDDFGSALSKSGILGSLNTLNDWAVIKTEYGELESGRAGRLYSISGESVLTVKTTYDQFWDRIEEEVENIKATT